MGFSATLIGIMGLLLPQAASWAKWPALAAGVFLLLSAWFLYQALKVRGYDKRPSPRQLREHLDAFSEEGLREWAADAISESVDDNNATLDHKAENLKWALRAFIFESFLVAIVAISIPF